MVRPSALSFMDKNKDGIVTKDESDFRGKFDQYDEDGDGEVTLAELKAALSKAGR